MLLRAIPGNSLGQSMPGLIQLVTRRQEVRGNQCVLCVLSLYLFLFLTWRGDPDRNHRSRPQRRAWTKP